MSIGGAAAAQAAPAISTDRSCYSSNTPLRLTGTGFTPGGPLEIRSTWVAGNGDTQLGPVFTVNADGSGAFAHSQDVPRIDVDHLGYRLTVTDQMRSAQGAPAAEQSATTTVRVSFFGAYFPPWNTDGPARGRPGRSSLLDVGGYLDSNSRILYVHYIRRGRLVKTLRLGRLKSPCGTLTKRFRQFDFRPIPAGTYSPRFDTSRTWPNKDLFSGYGRVVVSRRDAVSLRGRNEAGRAEQ
ncbi:MAG: hypothetical protein M3O90_06485 [Actinomycetota bacterium]|nr:hypothetical protein [Actinomycetota bacterium]